MSLQPLTVIIPALNEADRIGGTVANVRSCLPSAEILVVDGGSGDGTRELAVRAGARVVTAPAGRGVQCARGVDQAHGWWLLFLHADTTLPPSAEAVLRDWCDGSAARQIATFRLRFDRAGWFLRGCAWCTRYDSVFTRFGDQGILVRRDFYRGLGGFPEWPLFEDVELLRRARRVTRVWSLPAAVTTSARRFESRGVWRQQWLNFRLLMSFLLGASPAVLAEKYRQTGREKSHSGSPAVAPPS